MFGVDLLQWGAFGVLLAVLGAGFTVARWLLDRMMKQSEGMFEFVKSQIKELNKERAESATAWHDVTNSVMGVMKDNIVVNSSTAESLGRILEISNHQLEQNRQILDKLRSLNGKI